MQVEAALNNERRYRQDLEIFNMRSSKELAEITQTAYNRYLAFVRSFVTAFRIMDQEQADSIANDAYRNVLSELDTNRLGPGELASFFKKVIRNCAISSERSRISHSKGTVPLDLDESKTGKTGILPTLASSEIDPAAAAQWNEVGEMVLSTVAGLKDNTLKLIGLAMLREETGSKLRISRASGLSLSAVKNRAPEVTSILRSKVSRAV